MSAEAIAMAILGFVILFGGTAFGLARMGAESRGIKKSKVQSRKSKVGSSH